MKVRRYVAPDMRSALAMVREQQGPEVIILSNRSVDGGVELITADDEQAAAEHAAAAAVRRAAASVAPVPAGPVAPAPARPAAPTSEALWTREPLAESMREELQQLRRLVEGQMAGLAWGELGRRHPLRAGMLRRLVRLGLSPRLAEAIAAEVPDGLDLKQAWVRTLETLARRLPIGGDRILGEGGVYALVGPTGVGKSTLIAKLAVRHALAHGPGSVALVTTDDRRIGAHDQLRNFGRIIGVPVWTAATAAELRNALDAALDRRLILIDTAGAGHRDARLPALATLLAAGQPQLEPVLVLSAVTHDRVLTETVRSYAPMAPRGCICTKIDETASLGAVLGAALEARLPLLYASGGQRIPEDLEVASAGRLVRDAVRLAAATEAEDVVVETAFEGPAHAFH